MNTGYPQVFKKIHTPKAPAGLSASIMQRIDQYEVRRLRLRVVGHGILIAATLVLCVPAINYIAGAIAQSDFGTYLSLALSDSGYVASHWSNFMALLADSLPITGAIALLSIAAVFANSLRRMLGYLSSLSTHTRRLA